MQSEHSSTVKGGGAAEAAEYFDPASILSHHHTSELEVSDAIGDAKPVRLPHRCTLRFALRAAIFPCCMFLLHVMHRAVPEQRHGSCTSCALVQLSTPRSTMWPMSNQSGSQITGPQIRRISRHAWFH